MDDFIDGILEPIFGVFTTLIKAIIVGIVSIGVGNIFTEIQNKGRTIEKKEDLKNENLKLKEKIEILEDQKNVSAIYNEKIENAEIIG